MIDVLKRVVVGAAAAALMFATACSNRTGDTGTGGSGDGNDVQSSSGSVLEPSTGGSGDSGDDMGSSTTGSGADMGGAGDVGDFGASSSDGQDDGLGGGTGGSGVDTETVSPGDEAAPSAEDGVGGSGDPDLIQQQTDPNSWDSSTRTTNPSMEEEGAGTGGSGPGEASSSGSVLEDDADTEGDDTNPIEEY